MKQMQTTANRQQKKRKIITAVIAVMLVIAVGLGIFFAVRSKNSDTGGKTSGKTKTGQTTTTEAPKPTKATVLSTGDVLIHKRIYTNALKSDGTYDFNYCFDYIRDTVSKADLAVCNFEVTLGGSDLGYSAYPFFNCPDTIADALVSSGFDVALTANNHTGDTYASGMYRTLDVLKEAGLTTTGTTKAGTDKNYIVEDVNNIKIGIIDYTFSAISDDNRVSLNGNAYLSSDASACINAFDYDKLDSFYSEMKTNIANMKADGAEVIMLYIHWGTEYSLTPSAKQTEIAQKMCDLGVDVIVGGHPHVIQPIDVLTSDVSGKMTVCIYSVGNLLSNQRREFLGNSCTTGHTEDGVFFYTEFTKDSSGNVKLTGVSYTPLYVNYYTSGSKTYHQVVPLAGDIASSASSLGLDKASGGVSDAEASKSRTDALLSSGLAKAVAAIKQAA